MPEDILAERKRALEEEYFRNANAALIERLRASREQEDARKALQDASGITDTGILDNLIGAGINASALSALEVIPLVAVAWADGKLEAGERQAVLDSSAALGLSEGSAGRSLLEGWLAQQPPPTLLQTWEQYVRELTAELAPDVGASLCKETLKRAKAIAEARGGFLGLGSKISAQEESLLNAIEAAFSA